MPPISPQALMGKLNATTKKALESAAGLCLSRSHFLVEVEHWLFKLLDSPDTDLGYLLKQYNADAGRAKRELDAAINTFKTGNGRAPSLSQDILKVVQDAWVYGSLELGAYRIRSSFLLIAMMTNQETGFRLKGLCPEIGRLSFEKIMGELPHILPKFPSDETHEEATAAATEAPNAGAEGGGAGGPPRVGGKTPALDQFTVNLTEKAKEGKIDPVIGRDAEIRQVIDILTRRRQNNPILTGEAGVGKTAVVEGLALRIAEGDVPEPLKNVDLRTLDLGLLQAGAGVKGEFENRLKQVIQETKSSVKPVILFIDEAHTLIGAGGSEGQGDAANLLKPALARGELRTVAATTFAEYKKYFETDAALKRRFQQVKVDEPDETKAIRMLRGLVGMLEKHHGVRITEEAVTDAVRLSTRYIPDRQLPDKAISLLDTVCARVALSQSATPPALEDCRREIDHIVSETNYLKREEAVGHTNTDRLKDLETRMVAAEAKRVVLEAQLEKERVLVTQLRDLRAILEKDPTAANAKADQGKFAEVNTELNSVQGETPLVYPVVHGGAVAEVVSSLTGIPLGKMVRDEVHTILNLPDRLGERVVGQKHALVAIAQRIRTARADLGDPRRPLGVFLLVGPSGVGKTETAMSLADLLYGGDRNMVVVNMSEYKEAHKVSRLVGSSKGYVGYGEGGVLTNAVKNRPYSVVLLDEVEKAHESVQEIFYQVFDKGVLQNDNGEDVNFKNTIILLTANVGTDTIMKACADPDTIPSVEALAEMLRPDLLKAFKPALLGRMTVVPYFPLAEEVLKQIINLKLKQIGTRMKLNHKAAFIFDEAVVNTVAARCKDVESGARNVDHILTGTLLPVISEQVLTRMAEGKPVKAVTVGVGPDSNFTYTIE